jgi:sarcosine oxidase
MESGNTADVIVIGLGAAGAATLLALSRQGMRCIGIDRFHPPHDQGSSHGESRITRLAVGEGSTYAPLVRRSHELWRQLEAETGEALLLQTGGLVMGPRDGDARHHGKGDFVRRTIAIARENAIPHEVLAADELGHRFPQLSLVGNEIAYFEPSAGLVFPERCIATQLQLARQHGASLRLGEQVRGIEGKAGSVNVTTEHGRLGAAHVVVAAGPWTSTLARGPLTTLAVVYRQTLHWFATDNPEAYRPGRFPVFIWMHGDGEENYMYGFPSLSGTSTVKVASERYSSPVQVDAVERQVSAAESAAIYKRHVSGRLRGVMPKCERAAACLYTVTPDSGFIVDGVSEMDGVTFVSACSGHGFKHSAALGEQVARRLAGATNQLEPFGLSRFPT